MASRDQFCFYYFGNSWSPKQSACETAVGKVGSVHLFEVKWKSLSCVSLWLHKVYSPWNSPGQNTGVGCLSLLQGLFLTQGSNPCLPHCRRILYQLSHKGSPRILEWIAYPFASRSSQPRNQTRIFCIVGGFICLASINWGLKVGRICSECWADLEMNLAHPLTL